MDKFKLEGKFLSSFEKSFKDKTGKDVTYRKATFISNNGVVAEYSISPECFDETKSISNQEGTATFQISAFKMESKITIIGFDWK